MYPSGRANLNSVPRPPQARGKVLAAYVEILVTEGERAATLDAVAERAGVSKGGLLYHFGSREELVDGLLDRLSEVGDQDVSAMRDAPEGAVAYYLRTSGTAGDALPDLYLAAMRLTGDSARRASERMAALSDAWLELIADEVGDRELARLIQLVGDGLYFNALLESQTGVPTTSVDSEEVVSAVQRMLRERQP
jgi:AcrR family transcriptional regulator